jgi:hypothetical protein
MEENPFVDFLVLNALSSHSSRGEEELINAGQHFLLVRLFYERSAGELSRDRFEELSHEAWVTFVQSSLQAYYTWLLEVAGAPSAEAFEELLSDSFEEFSHYSDHLREEIERLGIFT